MQMIALQPRAESLSFKEGEPMLRLVIVVCIVVSLFYPREVAGQPLVNFPSPDGGVVYGYLSGSGDHLVIFAHGGRFTKESWDEQASWLAAHGYRTLAIDMRGRGQSRGGVGGETNQDLWYLDVMGAIAFGHGLEVDRISVVGASWGGWAAARASIELQPDAIDRLVLLAHSPIDEPELMQGRKLFITTQGDSTGNGTLRLPGIRDQFERASEPKELVVLEGSAHAQHVFRTAQGVELWDTIVRFLRRE